MICCSGFAASIISLVVLTAAGSEVAVPAPSRTSRLEHVDGWSGSGSVDNGGSGSSDDSGSGGSGNVDGSGSGECLALFYDTEEEAKACAASWGHEPNTAHKMGDSWMPGACDDFLNVSWLQLLLF
jgi:hypothetical protein